MDNVNSSFNFFSIIKMIKCTFDNCNFDTKWKSNSTHHIKTIHSNKKPYVCEDCQKDFTRRDDYNSHMNTHGKGTLLKCDHCDKTFKSRSVKHTHTVRVHEPHKLLKCPFERCGKSFPRQYTLKQHIKALHTTGLCNDAQLSKFDVFIIAHNLFGFV